MSTRYVAKIATLNRGWLYYSEQSPNKLDFRLPYAKRFLSPEDLQITLALRMRNRIYQIVDIKA